MESSFPPSLFLSIFYSNLGKTFLAPRRIYKLRTKGRVKTGGPYGKSQVLILTVNGTVRQAAMIPDKSAKRCFPELKATDTVNSKPEL